MIIFYLQLHFSKKIMNYAMKSVTWEFWNQGMKINYIYKQFKKKILIYIVHKENNIFNNFEDDNLMIMKSDERCDINQHI